MTNTPLNLEKVQSTLQIIEKEQKHPQYLEKRPIYPRNINDWNTSKTSKMTQAPTMNSKMTEVPLMRKTSQNTLDYLNKTKIPL